LTVQKEDTEKKRKRTSKTGPAPPAVSLLDAVYLSYFSVRFVNFKL